MMRNRTSGWLLVVLGMAILGLGAMAQGTPRYGGAVVIAMAAEAVTLDPLVITDVASANVFAHIVEALFDLTPEGDLEPLLATGYEVSPDGLTWTIPLRRGVTFHDGTPFNAEAAKFNLDRFRTRATFKFLIEAIQEVVVVDEYTIQLRLGTPFVPLLRGLAHGFTGMLSPTAVQAGKVEPVGTGAFKFVEWIRGDRIVLIKNPNYWGEGPYLDRVVFRPVLEPGTRVMMLLTGEADIIHTVPPDDVPMVKADPLTDVIRGPSFTTQYLGFNNRRAPFDDVRVRQAINYALNKEEIVEHVLGGFAMVADAPIGPDVFGHHSVGPYPYDPEKARELLAAAGYPDGFRTTLRFNPGWREVAAELIQAQLRKVGIEIELIKMEWGAYLAFTAQPVDVNQIDMFMLGWVSVTGDADYGLFPLFHTTEWAPKSNRVFYSNPRVDELLSQARFVVNPDERKALYAEAIEIIWAEAPWGFLHVAEFVHGQRVGLHGVIYHPNLQVMVTRAWRQ
ncbi:TPA: glutathione ABC transporter substrate-binding protein [Candidatus Acetothermia bacterium]|nr:glutathione ABC transporter substrate-binding protein [Candidatus Acetothermia bacterium]